MNSHSSSLRRKLAACSAAIAAAASVSAHAAPIELHWPEITLAWPPSPPDMLLIGSGLVLVLGLLFALLRSNTHERRAPPPQGPDLRWWKNPPERRDSVDRRPLAH